MADKKVKLKRLDELSSIFAGEDEENEILKPVRTESEFGGSSVAEDYDIGQSDNKSGRGMGWYVVHTYSGYEKQVKISIDKARVNRQLEDRILEVKVPMQEVIEIKAAGKKPVSKKVFPGYVLIHMDADDNDAWYVVRNTRGVTGFVGPGSKPVPLEDYEIGSLDKDEVSQSDYEIGETVMIVEGTWKDTIGKISRIDENKQTVTIPVEMFGGETPMEVKFAHIKKME